MGLIPTMGSLHEGHASLIRRAGGEVPRLLVTMFVNPAQFAPGEDLATYPRDEAGDLEFCRRLGVDAVWAPSVEEVYPPGVALPEPHPGPVGETFEGAARPGHLHGVLKVVHRLFDLTGPCRAYFGEKDAQQLFLVRRMVEGDGPARHGRRRVRRCARPTAWPIRRGTPGSSAEERDQAGCLFLALSEAAALARGGETRRRDLDRGDGPRDRRDAARAARLRSGRRGGHLRADPVSTCPREPSSPRGSRRRGSSTTCVCHRPPSDRRAELSPPGPWATMDRSSIDRTPVLGARDAAHRRRRQYGNRARGLRRPRARARRGVSPPSRSAPPTSWRSSSLGCWSTGDSRWRSSPGSASPPSFPM